MIDTALHIQILSYSYLICLFLFKVEILEYENLNIKSIITPVKAHKLKQLLTETSYDKHKTECITTGFQKGFSLEYSGPKKVRKTAPNLKLRVGSLEEIWNKVMIEVKAGRYAGPFETVPFKYYIQSPIGLVPKDKGKKTRLIFHLSYPKNGVSVNSSIPEDFCKVEYPNFNEAVQLCIEAGRSCSIAKSDMAMAFRNVPLSPKWWPYLVLKAIHPHTFKTWFFFDKCLPFGSSISCKIFQEISNSIAHMVRVRTGRKNLSYLDDYFFMALVKAICDGQVNIFLSICQEINFPVSLEKTHWGTTILIFLGLLIDTMRQVILIPKEKVDKALKWIDLLLSRKDRKATVLEIQKLCGTLNFLCKCVIPGRAFLHRLYSLTSNVNLKQHHHLRLTLESREDLLIWKRFVSNSEIFCHPFLDVCNVLPAPDVDLYSDVSGKIGFGAYCKIEWTGGFWNPDFIERNKPSIEFLELYGLTVGILLWVKNYKNRKIILPCDNESVKAMVNKSLGGCKNCMTLIRLIVLKCMVHNVQIKVEYVKLGHNGKADAISRGQWKRFRFLGKNVKVSPETLPSVIWPVEKIWRI